MQPDRTWNLMARKLTGEATAEEKNDLLQLIRSKPEVGLYLQALTNLWHQGTEDNRQKIAEAFEKIAGERLFKADQINHHKPDASFYIPGKNSIAMNFSKAGWKHVYYGECCEYVALN